MGAERGLFTRETVVQAGQFGHRRLLRVARPLGFRKTRLQGRQLGRGAIRLLARARRGRPGRVGLGAQLIQLAFGRAQLAEHVVNLRPQISPLLLPTRRSLGGTTCLSQGRLRGLPFTGETLRLRGQAGDLLVQTVEFGLQAGFLGTARSQQ